MRYVQSLPPLVEPTPDSGAVRAADHVSAVNKVIERTLPPMIYRHRVEALPLPAINRRRVPRLSAVDSDRRKICRRLHNMPMPEDLRSGIDRRHHNQRQSDLTTHIDEEV